MLSGKKALITGGAVRIGREIALQLARAGCEVVVQYQRSAAEAEGLVATMREGGTRAHALQADLRDEQDTDALLDQVWHCCGGLDILVNNAAVFHKSGLMDSDRTHLLAELAVNALAPISLMRAFARRKPMHSGAAAEGPVGRIVNILDRRVAGIEKGMLPYLLSKRMLRDATRIAALELGPGMSVNAVAPGPVLPPPGEGDSYLQDHAGAMVMGRRPTPADVAQAVQFLLESDVITGQVLFVDSGQHLL